jgi:hypothetical protein
MRCDYGTIVAVNLTSDRFVSDTALFVLSCLICLISCFRISVTIKKKKLIGRS